MLPAWLHIAGHATQGVALSIQDGHRHLGVHLGCVGMHVDVAVGVAPSVLPFPEVVSQEPGACGPWVGHLVPCGRVKRQEGGVEHRGTLARQGTKRRQVLHHVSGASKRAQHEVAFSGLNHHVAHRHGRDVVAPTAPIHTPVHAEVQAFLRAQEQQVGHFRVLNHAQHMGWNVFSVHQALPGLAAVGGSVEVRRPIVSPVVVGHNIHLVWVVHTHVDLRDPRPLRQPLQLGPVVRPRRPSVGGVLQASVIRAHPNFVWSGGGRGDAQDGAVVLRLGRVDGQASAGGLLKLVRVVGGQIPTQRGPGPSAIVAVVQPLGSEVKSVLAVRVQRQGAVPSEAQGHAVWRHRLDVGGAECRQVDAVHSTSLVHGVHVAVARGLHVETVPKQDLLPVLVANASGVPHGGRAHPGPVVLHAPIHVVGLGVVHGDVIKLAHRQIVDERPVVPAVAAEVQPTVVAVDEVVGVGRVDVQRVVIWVHAAVRQNHLKRPSAIGGLGDHAPQAEHVVLVRRVGVNLCVVEGAVAHVAVLGAKAEGLASVVRTVQRVVRGFHEGVDHVGIGRTHGQSHASKLALRKPVLRGALHPRLAAVVGHVQAAAFAPTFERPRQAAERPHGREQLVRVGRVHDQFGTSRALVHTQNVVPRQAAVGGLVHPASFAVAPS